jgi:hypothetical protein
LVHSRSEHLIPAFSSTHFRSQWLILARVDRPHRVSPMIPEFEHPIYDQFAMSQQPKAGAGVDFER